MTTRTWTITLVVLSLVLLVGLFVYIQQPGAPVAATPTIAAQSAAAAPATLPPATLPPAPQARDATPTIEVTAATTSPLQPAAPSPGAPVVYDYEVVNIYPHDRNAFTQGLVYLDGVLYEGTGLYGRSSLRRVELTTGEVLQQRDLDEMFFGEGIAVIDDKIYQLTWQNGVGFIYDRERFDELAQFTYSTEGWGLTYDGEHLIMSDGTPTLYFLDPATMQETRRITVTVEGDALPRLNELEYVDGKILANVWQTDFFVRIDPATGIVDGVYDFTGLLAQAPPFEGAYDVLNGIAYDQANDRLFVTGKLWPYLFEVKTMPR
jgi:glutamine cyclotransferase